MKKTKIIYWIFTGLLVALMVLGSIPDIMSVPDAVALFNHLGYPTYLLPFIGIAKLLGVVAILIPGFPRIKEWAYAGFVFDLT
ncbi:UNVERIFIED_CONTAM: DoxX family protein, partial [Bacillus sp. ATCC 13368]